MTFDEADARTTWIRAPYWAVWRGGQQGRSSIFDNWPKGYEAAFYGYSQWPDTGPRDDLEVPA